MLAHPYGYTQVFFFHFIFISLKKFNLNNHRFFQVMLCQILNMVLHHKTFGKMEEILVLILDLNGFVNTGSSIFRITFFFFFFPLTTILFSHFFFFRWQAIANMAAFRKATRGEAVANWWTNGK